MHDILFLSGWFLFIVYLVCKSDEFVRTCVTCSIGGMMWLHGLSNLITTHNTFEIIVIGGSLIGLGMAGWVEDENKNKMLL